MSKEQLKDDCALLEQVASYFFYSDTYLRDEKRIIGYADIKDIEARQPLLDKIETCKKAYDKVSIEERQTSFDNLKKILTLENGTPSDRYQALLEYYKDKATTYPNCIRFLLIPVFSIQDFQQYGEVFKRLFACAPLEFLIEHFCSNQIVRDTLSNEIDTKLVKQRLRFCTDILQGFIKKQIRAYKHQGGCFHHKVNRLAILALNKISSKKALAIFSHDYSNMAFTLRLIIEEHTPQDVEDFIKMLKNDKTAIREVLISEVAFNENENHTLDEYNLYDFCLLNKNMEIAKLLVTAAYSLHQQNNKDETIYGMLGYFREYLSTDKAETLKVMFDSIRHIPGLIYELLSNAGDTYSIVMIALQHGLDNVLDLIFDEMKHFTVQQQLGLILPNGFIELIYNDRVHAIERVFELFKGHQNATAQLLQEPLPNGPLIVATAKPESKILDLLLDKADQLDNPLRIETYKVMFNQFFPSNECGVLQAAARNGHISLLNHYCEIYQKSIHELQNLLLHQGNKNLASAFHIALVNKNLNFAAKLLELASTVSLECCYDLLNTVPATTWQAYQLTPQIYHILYDSSPNILAAVLPKMCSNRHSVYHRLVKDLTHDLDYDSRKSLFEKITVASKFIPREKLYQMLLASNHNNRHALSLSITLNNMDVFDMIVDLIDHLNRTGQKKPDDHAYSAVYYLLHNSGYNEANQTCLHLAARQGTPESIKRVMSLAHEYLFGPQKCLETFMGFYQQEDGNWFTGKTAADSLSIDNRLRMEKLTPFVKYKKPGLQVN